MTKEEYTKKRTEYEQKIQFAEIECRRIRDMYTVKLQELTNEFIDSQVNLVYA